ncbi:MAG: RsbW protein [Candidatus Tectimicrobiota bacterium]|nr:MAG: RsbW protein [Candidatus Tectomicrobia bacterium]
MSSQRATLVVPSRLRQLPYVRRWLQRVLRRWAVAADLIVDLSLAVTELCTNIIRHGYRGEEEGSIEICLCRDPDAVRITVRDSAPVFIPERVMPPPPEMLAEGGFGLFLIHVLVDDVLYERGNARGNCTTLVKYLPPTP